MKRSFDYIKGILFGIVCVVGFYILQIMGSWIFMIFDKAFREGTMNQVQTHGAKVALSPNELGTLILTGDLLIIVVIIVIFALKKNVSIKNTLKLKSFEPRKLLVVIPVAIGAAVCASMISVIICSIFGVKTAHVIKEFHQMNSIPAYIALIVVGPIAEEFLFRGFIFNYLDRRTSRIFAVIVSSIFFAVAHGNLTQGIAVFFLGLATALMYIYTDSILGDIIVHMTNNFIATFYGLLVLFISSHVGKASGGFFAIGFVILAPALLFIGYRVYKKQIGKPNKKFKAIIVALCIIAAVFFLLAFVFGVVPSLRHIA